MTDNNRLVSRLREEFKSLSKLAAEAIEVVRVEGKEKEFKLIIYLDRCVSCGQCVESCPTNCLSLNSEHEYAAYDRESLKTEYSV